MDPGDSGRMILKSSHTLMFMWYLWALDREAQRVLRPMMGILIDPEESEQNRYDAFMYLNENMTRLAREQDATTAKLRNKTWVNRSNEPRRNH